ncbi:MAG: MmcB family DNA repair protein [Alphaproteobacteria bacterium]|nr:MmcB family DNA repair protein [Alphaproteobacteria bacterium]
MAYPEKSAEDSQQARPNITEAVTKGAVRLMVELGFSPITEIPLTNGRRVDILALDRKGKSIIVEVKSSLADYQCDNKWQEYLAYCEEFYFAVGADFPRHVLDAPDALPETVGIIIADTYGGEIIRPATKRPVNAARKKTLILKMARAGAQRLSNQLLAGV